MNRRGLWATVLLGAVGIVIALGVWLGEGRPLRIASPGPAPIDVAPGARGFGLPPPPATPDNPQRIELGRKLYFDRRLSFNGTMSCAMCHVPEEGFASNASQLALGVEGRSLKRNAPTLLNVAWQGLLFHDGREPSLDALPWSALLHADEMANPSAGHVLARLRGLPDYAGAFERAFGGAPASMDSVGTAIAAFARSLVAADSRFDRWRYAADAAALSPLEQRGFEVFTGAGRCATCHPVGARDALFSDGLFHVTGLSSAAAEPKSFSVPLAPGVQTTLTRADLAAFADTAAPDLGRFEITLNPADAFAFKTPSLRNVARTAPYLHDGSMPTLEAVIEAYDRGGANIEGQSALITPLGLNSNDRQALAAFLRALDSTHLPALVAASRRPTSP
jgi:cytochrome c peroxidase